MHLSINVMNRSGNNLSPCLASSPISYHSFSMSSCLTLLTLFLIIVNCKILLLIVDGKILLIMVIGENVLIMINGKILLIMLAQLIRAGANKSWTGYRRRYKQEII